MEDVRENKDGRATASLILGIIGIIAWVIPIIGAPVTITGLVLGLKSRNSKNRVLAIIGIVLCIIGIVATVINAAMGAYLGATGALKKI